MNYSLNKEKAQQIAFEVLERIDKLELPPTPHIYELWYAYYSGMLPDVTRAIDVLVSNGIELTAERCEEIYSRFLGKSDADEALQKANDLVNATISDVTNIVESVKSATSDYSGSLSQATEKMGAVDSVEDMKVLMQAMMQQTKQMVEENQKLESKLNNSSSAMEKLKAEVETFKHEAMTDSLTGLANRKHYDYELAKQMEMSYTTTLPLSLIVLDIDFFKKFNDTYGHQVGDQVLRLVARVMRDTVKGKDLPARYGGEEFVVILPETELNDAEVVAQKIRQTVESKEVINRTTGEKLGRITISAGVAQLDIATEEDSAKLLERADASLYEAKRGGRNQVRLAPMPSEGKRRTI